MHHLGLRDEDHKSPRPGAAGCDEARRHDSRGSEMAIDEKLAQQVRTALADARQVREVRIKADLDARAVKSWVRLARAFVETLPAKPTSKTKSAKAAPKKAPVKSARSRV